MPRHQQIAISRLYVCTVCGGGEGTLTTDCPGTRITNDRLQEVFETNLDYTDARGWHLAEGLQSRTSRTPHVVTAKSASETSVDPRAVAAPSIDWPRLDRYTRLQEKLGQLAIAWALAERTAEDQSAICTRLEDEIDARQEHDPNRLELRDQLTKAVNASRSANLQAEKCNDEFRQAARRLLAVLENTPALP